MDIFSFLLSGPALTVLAGGVALGLTIRAFMALAKGMPDLRIRFDKTQRQLNAQLSGIPAFKETLTPQEKQAQKLQDYHNTLLEIERKYALAQQEKEASEEIQIHHRGSH